MTSASRQPFSATVSASGVVAAVEERKREGGGERGREGQTARDRLFALLALHMHG